MAREITEPTIPAIPESMAVYYVGLLRRGPHWRAEETPELERLQAAHLAYLSKLRESGRLILMGPILDDGDLRGLSIFRVRSLEEAIALGDADPAVKAGRFIREVHPWLTYRGVLPEPA